ncbi:2-methylcitrate dehydratase [Actinoplanes italicus]|uniref:2-methylcitrate dehydratase PrpD n=1 Tax=Actinoplanes italicus TaxID=113567 RepID=A0A2T0K092_9ACTN|nr:MmgE/PrpD family protein [Actinoplanes italicus]PRX16209.1 2-methylcitrate dehydratase PrpD [Actinoplanes italicus]GIE34284.1 2-methylcitrate dehydratase [Actinoplanes italicus]
MISDSESHSSLEPANPGLSARHEPAVPVLARWAAGLAWPALPPAVIGAAREHLIDAAGCAVAGIRRGAAEPALTVARGLGGPPEARLFTGERVGAVAAAFGNAVAVHALDFDDTHAGGLVHASAVNVPVALAVGEQTGARGSDVITAVVAGLEVTCRLGAAAPHGFHARGLHATSMCGVIGAAVTAGKLLGLDETRLAHAIGIAASGASGLLEFLHSPASTKQLHPGTAAANGILAARLAAAGATGPAGAVDGEYGLFRTMTGRAPDRDALLGALGLRWETTRIGIKPYPACQLTHASIDAAGEFTGSPPSALTVTLHPDAVPIVGGPEKRHPRSAYEAKFSVYWCVAAMVIDGWVDLDTFDNLDRPDVLSLASRITVVTGAADSVAADAPGIVAGDDRIARVERSSGGGARTKAAANLGPHAGALIDAVDRAGVDRAAVGDGIPGEAAVDHAAALLDAIEGCLR